MAAPGSAYSPKLWYKYDTGQTDNQGLLIRLPRALKEYALKGAGKTDWDQLTDYEKTTGADNWFIETFHCDLVKHYNFTWVHDDPESTATPPDQIGEPMYCVAGFLVDTNNPTYTQAKNARLHNLHTGSTGDGAINRKGKPRIKIGNTSYFLLNDGGLNARPWAEFCYTARDPQTQNTLPVVIMASPTGLSFRMNYWNAYYSTTSSIQVEVLTCNQNGTDISGRASVTYIISGINSAKEYDDYVSEPYIVTIENPQGRDSYFQENAYFKMRLKASNDEGTYVSLWSNETLGTSGGVYQISKAPDTWPVYKLNSYTEDPNSGIRYDIILQGGYSGSIIPYTPHGYYRAAVSGDDAPTGSGYPEYPWPTLYNIIGGLPYQMAGSGQGVKAYVAEDNTSRQSSFVINGARFGSTDNIYTSILPDGWYAHFPTVFPYDWDQQNIPDNICTYLPRLNEQESAILPIVYVQNGHVVKWHHSEYSGGGGGGGGSDFPAEITALSCSISTTDAGDGWYGYVDIDTNVSPAILTFDMKPKITLTGKGNVSIPILVEVYDVDGGELVWTSSVENPIMAQFSLGSRQSYETKTIEVEGGGDEGVPINKFPVVHGSFQYFNDASHSGSYHIVFKIMTDDEYNTYITPTPTISGDAWKESNQWELSAGPK